MNAVKYLALNHELLYQLEKQSYVTNFIHSVMKMKIDDSAIWASLARYVSENQFVFDLRNISNICYSMMQISVKKKIILNFDDLFSQLELSIIKKLDSGERDP